MTGEIPIFLKAEPVFHLGSFTITNSLLLSWLILAIFGIGGLVLSKKWRSIPGKIQAAFEMIVEGVLNLMESVLGNRGEAEKYLPFIATIFLFITFSNWMGIFPVLGTLGIFEGSGRTFVPLFRSPASDLNFTIALAVISIAAVNIAGARRLGFFKHFKKFFNFTNPINFFVGILEFFSEFAKMISFSFRLFGNIFAGEVLLIIMASLLPYLAPIPFLFLEIFVGFIQAFIFGMLTLVFIAGAVREEH